MELKNYSTTVDKITISIPPMWWDHLQVAPLTPWWPKLELKILPHLAQSIDSEIMDGFWHQRCLNNCINLFYMIGSFASGTNVSLVTKNGAKKNHSTTVVKSSPVNRFQSLRCLNDHINLPYMMGSLAIGATNSLVAKIGTIDFATFCSVYRFWTSEQILIFKVSKRPYQSPHMIGSLGSSATSSLVAKK